MQIMFTMRILINYKCNIGRQAGMVAHLTGDQEVAEIDHEIFSTVILFLQQIQEGQLSVSGERMCTILVNCLDD